MALAAPAAAEPCLSAASNKAMSFIDTFDNEFVGYFGGLPVYHPLELVPVSDDDPRCFGCGPDNLVIGGGPGEHPGIVVKAPGEAVVCFVDAWLEEDNPHLTPEVRQRIQPAIAAWPDAPNRQRPHRGWRHVFEFAGWRVEDYVRFAARCVSPAFHRPFDPAAGDLESWLAASVGEFVLCAMPELAAGAVQRLGDLRHHVSGGTYNNILLLPPGYPIWGRREVDHRVVWGLSAWVIQRQQNSTTRRCT